MTDHNTKIVKALMGNACSKCGKPLNNSDWVLHTGRAGMGVDICFADGTPCRCCDDCYDSCHRQSFFAGEVAMHEERKRATEENDDG